MRNGCRPPPGGDGSQAPAPTGAEAGTKDRAESEASRRHGPQDSRRQQTARGCGGGGAGCQRASRCRDRAELGDPRMTGALLEATVKEALQRRKNPRLAIGIQSATPPDREQVLDLRVAWCRSMLEMREYLSGPEPGQVVLVSPLEDGDLADDIRARLHKRTLLPVDVKEVLKQRYGARDIERRVSDDAVLCGALFRCGAAPVLPGGILYEEAAWQGICP